MLFATYSTESAGRLRHSACARCGVRKRCSAASAASSAARVTRSACLHRPTQSCASTEDGPRSGRASSQNCRAPMRNMRLARCCGSRKPAAGSTSHRSAAACRAIQVAIALLVGRPPKRTMSSGFSAAAVSGSRNSTSAPWISESCSAGPARSPEAGSASTGQPSDVASASAAAASDASQWSGPKSSTPRAIPRSSRASVPDPSSAACASDVTGARATPAGRGAGSILVGTSGSRNGRLRCTGPGAGPVASKTARRASARAYPGGTPSDGQGASSLQRVKPA